MQVNIDQLRSSFVKAGLACQNFDDKGMTTVNRLAMTLQMYQREKASTLVRNAGRRAVLFHYQNDATSYLTRFELAVGRPDSGDAQFRRRHRQTSEFLCERSFLITFEDDGEPVATAVVHMPRSMRTGHTAWHCYQCSTKAYDLLKEMGHQGISITHYCYDRAKFTAILSLQQGRHNLWAQAHRSSGGDPMQPLLDWVLGTGCALHDASKALQWALDPFVEEKEMLKDLYVVIESCRSSFDLLVEYLHVFLARHMERSTAVYSKDEVAQWWRAMGVAADWVELLTNLNPTWRQGKLMVSDKIDGKRVSADLVADCMVYLFRFSKFSQTRWCGVGHSCRALICALSVGLYPLALLALELKQSLETKLHGIKRLSEGCKWYAAIASIATFVPEAFSIAVAEDDRICRRLDELEDIVIGELDWVYTIDRFVYQRLAFIVKGLLWESELKDACLQASQSAVAFLSYRVFSVAHSLPWSLTLGDIGQNLTDLAGAEGPQITDPVSKKICRLLELGPKLKQVYIGFTI